MSIMLSSKYNLYGRELSYLKYRVLKKSELNLLGEID